MSDYASLIGGSGTEVPIGSVDPNEAFAYFWNSGSTFLDMGAGDDFFQEGPSAGPVTVAGGTGDDTIYTAGHTSDLLSGQDGNDVIDASGGNNTLPGGGNTTLAGGNGDDSMIGGSGDNYIDGGMGDDTAIAGAGNDQMFGGNGNDNFAGESGNDSIYGGSGDDTLLGGADDDYLSGGSDNDFLSGDGGNDTLYGGSGSDVFYFDSNFGSDVIKDFSGTSGDQIWLKSNLNGSGINSAGDVTSHVAGGTDPLTGLPYTTITIGSDVIRIDNMDHTTFEANIANWVKIQP